MVTIVANFKVKKDCVAKFKSLALVCVKGTRKEKGNLSYKVYQSRNDETSFTFIEEWLNDAAIAQHNSMPHFISFIDEIKPLCECDPLIEQIMAVPSAY